MTFHLKRIAPAVAGCLVATLMPACWLGRDVDACSVDEDCASGSVCWRNPSADAYVCLPADFAACLEAGTRRDECLPLLEDLGADDLGDTGDPEDLPPEDHDAADVTGDAIVADSDVADALDDVAVDPDTTLDLDLGSDLDVATGEPDLANDPDVDGDDNASHDPDVSNDPDLPGDTDIARDSDVTQDPDGDQDGGPVQCEPVGVCVPEVPLGWEGPFTVWDGLAASSPPLCPPEYPNLLPGVFSGLVAGPAMCDCGCTRIPGTITCAAELLRVESCGGAPVILESWDVGQTCTPVPTLAGASTYRIALATLGGSCSASLDVSIEDASWGFQSRLCGGTAVGAGCESGSVCVPPSSPDFEANACIRTEGVSDCPLEYPNRRVRYENFSDTRTCSACSCGAIDDVCAGFVERYPDSACGAFEPRVLLGVGSCESGTGSSPHARYVLQLNGSCPHSGGVLQGNLAPVDPMTICCLE